MPSAAVMNGALRVNMSDVTFVVCLFVSLKVGSDTNDKNSVNFFFILFCVGFK